MNMKHSLIGTMVLAIAVTTAAGCSVARHQETVGEYVDGSKITTEVKAKLADDKTTSSANIHVKTMEGGDVQLSGFAKSAQERQRAGQIARSVKGVHQVHNNLVIKAPNK